MNDRLSIETPENVLLNPEVAGLGSRCVAAVIDYLILLVVLVIAILLFLQSIPPGERTESSVGVVVVLIQFVILTFYHLALELFWNGQTIGKRAVGIRVVQANGLPLTASGAIIRNFVRLFDFLPVFYGIGLIVLFATKHGQRLGDLAARTVVIREQRQLTLNKVRQDYTVSYLYVKPIDPAPASLDITMLTQEDRWMIVNFLQRRNDIKDREQLAQILARRIADKMNLPYGTSAHFYGRNPAEAFLEHVARAFEIVRPD